MIKISKQKLFATTLLFAVLMVSSTYASLLPSAHAQEVTTSTAKGLAIINQAVGVDLTKYKVTSTLDANAPSLTGLPTESIHYTLQSSGSRIDMLDTFENGSLVLMDVLQNGGYPHVTAPIGNPISMAKSFLLNYQNYAENSLYGQLASTLNKADPFVNSTSIVGNLKFEITATYGNSTMGESSTFTWSYTVDGVNAPCKCVSLGYTDGFLKVFIDNWNIYSVGSTIVNISEQTAENIAMKNAKTYSYTVGSGNEMYIINHFNVTQPMYEELIFSEVGNAPDARSSNPLELYPMWRIGVGLDKYYPDKPMKNLNC